MLQQSKVEKDNLISNYNIKISILGAFVGILFIAQITIQLNLEYLSNFTVLLFGAFLAFFIVTASLLFLGLKSVAHLATDIEISDDIDLDKIPENKQKEMIKYFIRAYQSDLKQDKDLYDQKIKIFDTSLILVGIMLSITILSLIDYIFVHLF